MGPAGEITVRWGIAALKRKRDDNDNWTAWETNESDLEAALCLWVFSIKEAELLKLEDEPPRLEAGQSKPHKQKSYVRLLGSATNERKEDYELWIKRTTPLFEGHLDPQEVHLGRTGDHQGPSNKNVTYLKLKVKERDLAKLCAQELYTWLMFKLRATIGDVQGETNPCTNNPMTEMPLKPNSRTDSDRFYLINSNLALLADSYESSGLGSIESAYLCIIPALRASGKLPVRGEALTKIRSFWNKDDIEARLKSKEGNELFRDVVADGHYKTVEWLLDAGAQVNPSQKLDSERTPLRAAADSDYQSVVKLLLAARADVNAEPPS